MGAVRSYRATYRDAHGVIATTIENDGAMLTMALAGVVFRGRDFDLFEPESLGDATRFTLAGGSLCACTLSFVMPVIVVVEGRDTSAALEVELVLGGPRDGGGGISEETLRLQLLVNEQQITSRGTWGWFEDELLDLQKALAPNAYLKMCFGCGLSDYSPYGHGLFGGLACFRDERDAYYAIRRKEDLLQLWERNSGLVQETYLCPSFEPRQPGTGYRG